MILIQVKSEADLAKLIDLVRKNPDKAGQSLYDASARWENMYFGEDSEPAVVTFPTVSTVDNGEMKVPVIRGGRVVCTNTIRVK